MIRFAILSALLGCPLAALSACTISVTNVQTCDATGNPAPWSFTSGIIGARVSFTVTGAPVAPYSILFQFADASPITFNGPTGAGNFVEVCTTSYPTLFPIPVKVAIDPTNVSGNTTPAAATITKNFQVSPPTTHVAYFGQQTLFASDAMSVPVTSGRVAKLVFLMGKPTTDTFQSVLSDTTTGLQLLSTPDSYPVFETVLTNVGPGTYNALQKFQITSSNTAVNLASINATWAQMDALKTPLTHFLAAEPGMETTDPNINAFVTANLPANFRTVLTPLQTAERLYGAVVRTVSYSLGVNGDAKVVLANKVGDCGGFSDLYDTCLRIVGIPSRMDAGWLIGTNQTHAWSELYFPNIGWIPADGSFARKTSTTGTYMPFFGYLPTGNQRCAACRACTLTTPDISTGFVQGGNFAVAETVPATLGTETTTVVLSTTPI